MLETLANPYGLLGRAVLEQMQLTSVSTSCHDSEEVICRSAYRTSARLGGRTMLAGVAAGAVVASAGPAAQQPAPAARAKGPLVWLDMDQKELDDAYDQRVYAPNLDQVIKRYATNSELVRARLGAPKRLAYGATPIEALDLYPAKRPNAPINVYVHGGAWRTGLAKNNAFPAEMLLNAGAHFVVLDFNNVIETGGSLMLMAEQVRRGVAWVYKNAASFGGDPERLYVCGHSSGGHWAASCSPPIGKRTSACRPT